MLLEKTLSVELTAFTSGKSTNKTATRGEPVEGIRILEIGKPDEKGNCSACFNLHGMTSDGTGAAVVVRVGVVVEIGVVAEPIVASWIHSSSRHLVASRRHSSRRRSSSSVGDLSSNSKTFSPIFLLAQSAKNRSPAMTASLA